MGLRSMRSRSRCAPSRWGVAYAIWSGVGIVGIALIGRVVFRQALDAPALIGIGLILAGVLVLNLFSASAKDGG